MFLSAGVTSVRAAVDVAWVAPTRGVSIATDAQDHVFTADYEQALGSDITVTKRDADGALLWQVSPEFTQSPFWERAQFVATDPDGNAIVCGTRMSGFSNPMVAASVIMKFNPDGELLWRHLYESDFDGSSTRKCLVDAEGSSYVLGFGSGPSGFVTKVKKFAADGQVLWTWFDSAGIGAPINFKFTPDGAIVITGRSIFGSVNGYARISLDGADVWSLPGISSLTVGDCAGDAFGNTYLVHGEFVANGGTVIRKLDPQGATLWEEVYGLAGFRVEVGTDHRAVVSGFPNTATGGAAFIKVDEEGGVVWQNLDADGPLNLLLHAQMLLDEENNAYLAASTLFEMAVCKVGSDGVSAWTATTSGSNSAGIALGHDGQSIYVVGGATARLIDTSQVPADLDGDGDVDGADLGLLLGAWGSAGPVGDLNGDGIVDGADLGALLGAWNGSGGR